MPGKDRKYILIVEDDKELLELLAAALTAAGFSVFGVGTLREAQFKLKNQKYSCVVLDLRLGKENGADLVEYMRGRPGPNKDSPILIASGTLDAEIAKTIAGKVQGAIVKPYEPAALVERVKKIIGN